MDPRQHPGDRNKELREASGNVDSSDPLVTFLYLLMRDHLPPGEVESIIDELHQKALHQHTQFTNGWLAEYAKNVATALKDEEPEST